MPSDKAILEFSGKAEQILQSMTSVIQKQEQMIAKMEQSNALAERHTKTTKEFGDAMQELAGKAESVVKGFVGFEGVTKAFEMGKEAVKGYMEFLDKTAESQNKAASGMRGMAATFSNAKDMAAAMDRAQSLAMDYGLTTDQTANMVKSAHRFAATHPGADENDITKQAAGLTRLGVDAGTATEAITGGVAAGLTPQQAADLAVRTADRAGLDIGRSANLARRFSNPFQGSAIMAELSAMKGYKSERELMSFIGAAQEGLDADPTRKGPEGRFARSMAGQAKKQGLDWASMGEVDKLNFIASVMPNTSAAALENKGMSDLSAKQISRLIAHRGELAGMGVVPEAGLAAGREGEIGSVQPMSQEERARQSKAAAEVVAQKGIQSGSARGWEESEESRGARLQGSGMENLTEGGKPTFFGRLMLGLSNAGRNQQQYIGQPMEDSRDRSEFLVSDLIKTMEAQKTQVEEHTEALRENTAALKGAGGGATVANMSPSTSSGYIAPNAGNGH